MYISACLAILSLPLTHSTSVSFCQDLPSVRCSSIHLTISAVTAAHVVVAMVARDYSVPFSVSKLLAVDIAAMVMVKGCTMTLSKSRSRHAGDMLRLFRQACGHSMRFAARQIGCSHVELGHWERGQASPLYPYRKRITWYTEGEVGVDDWDPPLPECRVQVRLAEARVKSRLARATGTKRKRVADDASSCCTRHDGAGDGVMSGNDANVGRYCIDKELAMAIEYIVAHRSDRDWCTDLGAAVVDVSSDADADSPKPIENRDVEDIKDVSEYMLDDEGSIIDDVEDDNALGLPYGMIMPTDFFLERINKTMVGIRREYVNRNGEVLSRQVTACVMWIGASLVRFGSEADLLRVDFIDGCRQRHGVIRRGLLNHIKMLAVELRNMGVKLTSTKTTNGDLATFLASFAYVNDDIIPKKIAQGQTGWNRDYSTFLLGKTAIGDNNYALYSELFDQHDIARLFCSNGNPASWRAVASDFVSNSPAAGLVLAASVASPLLRPLGLNPIGIVLSAETGRGKTTLLRLGASVWGCHGDPGSREANDLIGTGNSTDVGFMGQFMHLSDLPHLVEEVKSQTADYKSRETTERWLHSIADCVDRSRLRRDGGVQKRRRSAGCAIVATEVDIKEFIIRGGAVRRFLPISQPYSSNSVGIFINDLHAHYGHAGHMLMEQFVPLSRVERSNLGRMFDNNLKFMRSEFKVMSEILRTWSEQFAVALTAADIACKLCPDVFPDHEIWTKQIIACWHKLVHESGTNNEQLSEHREAMKRAIEWMQSLRNNLQSSPNFDPVDTRLLLQKPTGPIIGRILEVDNEGHADEHIKKVALIQSKLSGAFAAKGHSLGSLLYAWANEGWIVGDKSKKYRQVRRISGCNQGCLVLDIERISNDMSEHGCA